MTQLLPQAAPPTESYLPATFLARGVAVPFTTPQLAGARVRPGQRQKPELILPSPAGKAGVYIVTWQDIGSAYRLSVHDTRLAALIARLTVITPTAIRDITREVAAEGLAGREAMAAALAAVTRDEAIRAIRHRELLQALVTQQLPPASPQVTDAAAIGLVAFFFIGSGLAGPECDHAPLALELAAIAKMRHEVAAYAATHAEADAAALLHVTELTLLCARAALRAAQQLAADMPALLRRWQSDRDALIQLLARPDWLLDGWARIAALWRHADPSRRGIAIMEMSSVMPILPTEVGAWLPEPVDISHQLIRSPGRVTMRQDWRSGIAPPDLVARNESLLAVTL